MSLWREGKSWPIILLPREPNPPSSSISLFYSSPFPPEDGRWISTETQPYEGCRSGQCFSWLLGMISAGDLCSEEQKSRGRCFCCCVVRGPFLSFFFFFFFFFSSLLLRPRVLVWGICPPLYTLLFRFSGHFGHFSFNVGLFCALVTSSMGNWMRYTLGGGGEKEDGGAE